MSQERTKHNESASSITNDHSTHVDLDQVELRIEHNPDQTLIVFDAIESGVSGVLSVDVGDIPLHEAMDLAHGIRQEAEHATTGRRLIPDGGEE